MTCSRVHFQFAAEFPKWVMCSWGGFVGCGLVMQVTCAMLPPNSLLSVRCSYYTTHCFARMRAAVRTVRLCDWKRLRPTPAISVRDMGFLRGTARRCRSSVIGLLIEGFCALDTVPRKKPNHHAPAFTAFAALAEIPLIRPDGAPTSGVFLPDKTRIEGRDFYVLAEPIRRISASA